MRVHDYIIVCAHLDIQMSPMRFAPGSHFWERFLFDGATI